jgi:hypothetical protein
VELAQLIQLPIPIQTVQILYLMQSLQLEVVLEVQRVAHQLMLVKTAVRVVAVRLVLLLVQE